MNLKDYCAKSAGVVTDKDTIRNVVKMMARLPTDGMYSSNIYMIPHDTNKRVSLHDRAFGYFRDVLNDEKMPETFPELLLRFSNYFADTDFNGDTNIYYDCLSLLPLGFSVMPDNKKK